MPMEIFQFRFKGRILIFSNNEIYWFSICRVFWIDGWMISTPNFYNYNSINQSFYPISQSLSLFLHDLPSRISKI